MKRRDALALVLIAAIALTCKGDSPTEPVPEPGWLRVSLSTPNGDDGGIMFVVGGGVVDYVRSSHPHGLTRSEEPTTHRIIVGGSIGNGVIAQIWVPDQRKVADYSATVLEVARRGTFGQRLATGYSLSIQRIP